jgi:cytochrome c553
MNYRIYCSAMLMVALTVSVSADESLPSDEMQVISEKELNFLISECSACHGQNGVSHNDKIPSLAGKSAEYILENVEKFYFYERHCPDADYQNGAPKSGARNMCDVADRLTKQEVLALGKYFESQPAPGQN